MALNRVRVALTGFAGLPGVCTFHLNSTQTDMGPLRTFFDAAKLVFPNAVTIQVASSGDTINEADGKIQGAWSGPVQAPIVGTGGSTAIVSTSGVMIRWTSPQVINGRRPIGKTFLVPCVSGILTAQGQIGSTITGPLTTAAQAMVTAFAGDLRIYHRPKVTPPSAGSSVTITQGVAIAKLVVLRSRRD